MATCYNAKWNEDSPCATGYYLHAIQRNFSTANDLNGLTGATCCQLQDASTSYGSCTTLTFSSTVESWPVCPDNYLLTGIRRKRQSNTLDDIDGFHCCTPPSNEIPKVVPECRNKVDQFGRNVAGADVGGVCPSTTIDCATKALSLSTVSDWRL